MKEITIDPITYEIMSHKLWQVVQEMGITVSRVTGSTVTIEAKDLMVGLYDGEGNLVATGAGVIYHSSAFQAAIRYIIDEYSESPGIYDGDVFIINDPYICAVHKPDAAVLSPIFYKGERVGWAGAMTHLIDIGGMDPAGFSPRAREVFQEGFNLRGVKLAEKGKIRKENLETICSMSRDPAMVGLDLRGEMAASEVAKKRLMEMIDEHGIEFYEALLKEVMSHSEARLRGRLRELPDGVWQTREYIDSDGVTDKIYEVNLTLTKQGDRLLFDFTGTSEQAPTYINCTASGMRAGVYSAISTILAYDIPWNQGIMNCYEIKCPDGVVINCRFPAPCGLSSLTSAAYVFAASVHVISKMLSCSDGQKEDAIGLWGVLAGCTQLTAIKQEEWFGVSMLMDMEALGGGARTYSDGIDSGGNCVILGGSQPNVERYEAAFPVLCLFRRQTIDSGGAGKYRGGVGGETAYISHGITGGMDCFVVGTSMKIPTVYGLSGGYPGNYWARALVRESDIEDRLAQGQLPQRLEDLPGRFERIRTSINTQMFSGDVYYFQWQGGGGYGDPVDRDAEMVRQDIMNELVSVGCARETYGVVVDPDTLGIDVQRTQEKRKEVREMRAKAGEGKVSISLVAEVQKKKLSSGEWGVECPRCGYNMKCTDNEFLCLSKARALTEASPAYIPSERAYFQEYYCPGCQTLLHTEVVTKGAG